MALTQVLESVLVCGRGEAEKAGELSQEGFHSCIMEGTQERKLAIIIRLPWYLRYPWRSRKQQKSSSMEPEASSLEFVSTKQLSGEKGRSGGTRA